MVCGGDGDLGRGFGVGLSRGSRGSGVMGDVFGFEEKLYFIIWNL